MMKWRFERLINFLFVKRRRITGPKLRGDDHGASKRFPGGCVPGLLVGLSGTWSAINSNQYMACHWGKGHTILNEVAFESFFF